MRSRPTSPISARETSSTSPSIRRPTAPATRGRSTPDRVSKLAKPPASHFRPPCFSILHLLSSILCSFSRSRPMSPLAPAVLVLEKAPRWESELKRRISGPQLLVRPCRSAEDVLSLCRQMPGSVVVIDFDAGVAEGLRLLEALDARRLRAVPVVVASRELDELEWPA